MVEIDKNTVNCCVDENDVMSRLPSMLYELFVIGAFDKCDDEQYKLTRNGHAAFGLMLMIDEFGHNSEKTEEEMNKELTEKGLIKIVNEDYYVITGKGMSNVILHLMRDQTNEEVREYVKMKMDFVGKMGIF